MQKLDESQLSFINNEIKRIEERINYLSSTIVGDDVSQLKKDFITENIKQLNVVKDQLTNMLKQ